MHSCKLVLRQLVKWLIVYVARQVFLFRPGELNTAEILGYVYWLFRHGVQCWYTAIMASDILIRMPATEKYF